MIDNVSVAKTYREKSARCRRLARQTTDRKIAERLIELALELEQLATQAEQIEE